MTVRVSHVSRHWWGQVPEAEREAIAAAVPDGHIIYIYPGHRATPGVASVSLRRKDTERWGAISYAIVREERGRDLAHLCRLVLA